MGPCTESKDFCCGFWNICIWVCLKDCDNLKESEGRKQDLRSRGLCLVPISSTFPVANESSVDFWTPTFGGAVIGR